MNIFKDHFMLRFAIAVILLMHSVPSFFNNSMNEFGNLYLNQKGFSPVGVPLAWAIKLSHVACAICLLMNIFIKPASLIFILILIVGIMMVHFSEGWYVVGAGRNGIEFNFLLIFCLLEVMFGFTNKLKTIAAGK
ncbi:MAG: DoxX family protein [Niastella sp.]|nr:DoxX family protein [Niastella sp.]